MNKLTPEQKRFAEILDRCRLACGAEAVARGFPEEAGHDMLAGCTADDVENWDDQQFLEWMRLMDEKYEQAQRQGMNPLMKLYVACSGIMGSYAPLLESLIDSDLIDSDRD